VSEKKKNHLTPITYSLISSGKEIKKIHWLSNTLKNNEKTKSIEKHEPVFQHFQLKKKKRDSSLENIVVLS